VDYWKIVAILAIVLSPLMLFSLLGYVGELVRNRRVQRKVRR